MIKVITAFLISLMLSVNVYCLPSNVQEDEDKTIHYDIPVSDLSSGKLYLEYLHFYQYYNYYNGNLKGLERMKDVIEEMAIRIEKEQKQEDLEEDSL